MKKTRNVTIGSAVALLALLAAVATPQSLGDAARREEERRKKNRQSGLKAPTFSGAGAQTPSGGTTVAATKPAPARPDPGGRDESDQRKLDEEAWRRRMAQSRARLDGARRDVEFLSSLIMVPGKTYVNEDNQTVISSTDQLQRMTAEARAELEAAKKAVEDVEEDARRAGVPAGWVR